MATAPKGHTPTLTQSPPGTSGSRPWRSQASVTSSNFGSTWGFPSVPRPPTGLLSQTGEHISRTSVAVATRAPSAYSQPGLTPSLSSKSKSTPSLSTTLPSGFGFRRSSEALNQKAKVKYEHGATSRSSELADRENSKTARLTRSLSLLQRRCEEEDGTGSESPKTAGDARLSVSSFFATNTFPDDLVEVENIIASLTGSRRFERTDTATFDDVAEKRQRKSEQRNSIRQSFDARDPRRKVEMKLDNRRHLEMEQGPRGPRVPMTMVSVLGKNGVEEVQLVNVQSIRARCKHLGNAGAVDSMMEDLRTAEKEQRTRELSAETPDALAASLAFSQLTLREKCLRARQQKRSNHIGEMLRKIQCMRSDIPEEAENMLSRLEVESLRFNKELTLFDEEIAVRTRRRSVRESRSSLAAPKRESSSRARLASVIHVKCERGSSARRRWGKVRACAMFLLLYTERHRRIRLVRDFVEQLGEWSRVRRSISKMQENVKKLQRVARDFLARKRQRCEIIEKDWARIEDKHLFAFFKLYAQMIMDDWTANESMSRRKLMGPEMPSSKPKPGIFQVLQQESGLDIGGTRSLVERTIDWRQYRIPVAERKNIIGMFYMVQLQRHIRGKTNAVSAFQSVLAAQKDLIGFLKEFGADVNCDDTDFAVDMSPRPITASFWCASEDTILNMIALVACDLRNTYPYQEHPSHKDIAGNTMFRGDAKALHNLKYKMLVEKRDVMDLLQPKEDEEFVDAEDLKVELDIDDVIDGFTLPRSSLA